jgi:hypothetical protein
MRKKMHGDRHCLGVGGTAAILQGTCQYNYQVILSSIKLRGVFYGNSDNLGPVCSTVSSARKRHVCGVGSAGV